MNEPRVYKNSPATLIVIVVFFLLLIGVMVFATGFSEGMFFILPMSFFALIVFGSIFIAVSAKITVSEDEISAQNVFGTRSLHWSEISRVSGRGYQIKLHNFNEDVTVAPSSGLPGYEEVVEFIGRKRPDLFRPQEYSEMRRSIIPFITMALVSLLLIAGMAFFVLEFFQSITASLDSLFPLLVFVIIIFVLISTMFSIPRVVLLEGSTLILKYLFSEKTLNANEIRHIQFWYTQSRNGKHYFIALHLTNGKNIRLSGLAISLPIAYLVLKNWHSANMHGQSSTGQSLNNIAPNWSDNTWK